MARATFATVWIRACEPPPPGRPPGIGNKYFFIFKINFFSTNFRLHEIAWVIIIMSRSRKDPYSTTEEISGGEKKLFLIIVNVLGHPKRGRGLTSYFLHGGGMDVFWDDPRGYFLPIHPVQPHTQAPPSGVMWYTCRQTELRFLIS